jgi:DNA-binding NarL/FixJ family response regulator
MMAPERTRIVIADDHPIVLAGLSTMLAQVAQLEVVAIARSFDQVLASAQEHVVDVVILDLGGMDGSPIAVIQQLTRDYPRLKVIVFSSTIDLAPELLEAGAMGYVAKEELPSVLVEAITAAMASQQFFSPLVREYLEQSTRTTLTPKELVSLKLLAQGLTTPEIAAQLQIDPRTVQNYITSMRRKTGCLQRTQLVDWYRRTYDGTS